MDTQTEAETVETELPEPRIEELEDEWAALGCGCDCGWGGEFD